ncbi:chemotaxis protein CheW [Treponema phagedenis]|uniref:CheR methyltransferase, SAM binding domain protein n=1 Tax=Treponema phagedenis TaxID=162 RepID=A0A0B7GXL6_TREPH|nr:CheR family methyltransferase [Treponema phagedenis]NVP24885.1 chemotaxis protein CheW [Treponema phagedenis]QEJ94335.1 chemotaxis protein CheW [Treponema phagedenis]QEJ98988.1 chemotaxis protein CheW [Treponema phagedenis]QEK00297.1 chemotaxis protein CheW [Treponema phagedenis]QEK04496.1 chemotaxis protein CheW [Treponema phagedenis]
MENINANINTNEITQENYSDALREQLAVIDFKMVTFSLAGKDYAIDIMQVKEIAKADNFTYVPNTSPFVIGVYNLRGDIIPIIDLRIFFNISVKKREKNSMESMVIITVEDQTFGVVVDHIDKVVGVSSHTIQPPHPIFGDINIKYIHGVVENAGRLYILLDVNRIFASKTKEEKVSAEFKGQEILPQTVPESNVASQQSEESLDIRFISDTLAAFGKFYASSINDDWLRQRYLEWRELRDSGDTQLQNEDDVKEFLSTFLSPHTKQFWSENYAKSVQEILPENSNKIINVWNVGCASGYETYSFAVLLKKKYPNSVVRIYANDSDLLAISNAPMLTIPEEKISSMYRPYVVKGVSGAYTFSSEIKDMILFEYHDCAHQNTVPDIDIILARDVLSFMSASLQSEMLQEFREKLKTTGVVILGQNEVMPRQQGWLRAEAGGLAIFSKE